MGRENDIGQAAGVPGGPDIEQVLRRMVEEAVAAAMEADRAWQRQMRFPIEDVQDVPFQDVGVQVAARPSNDYEPGMPFGGRWPWGLVLAGAVASVYNGRVERYPNKVEATSPTDITFTEAGTFYIGAVHQTNANPLLDTLTIEGPLDDEPENSEADVVDGIYRFPLYKIVATDDGGDPAAVVALLMTRDYIHGMKHPQVYG